MKNYKLKIYGITIIVSIIIGYFVYFPKVYNIYHELTKITIELPEDFDFYHDKEPINPSTPTYQTFLEYNPIFKTMEYVSFIDYEMHLILLIAILCFVWHYVYYRKKCNHNYKTEYSFQNNYEDPIGKYMYWHATKNNMHYFLGERLVIKEKSFLVKPDKDITILAYFLISTTTIYYLLNLLETHYKEHYWSFLDELNLFYASGGGLIITGAVLLWLTKPKTIIDGEKKIVFVDKIALPFEKVYALQFVKKKVFGIKTTIAYELNLVTNIGERHNLLNHCDKKYILENMLIIQKYFNVHVWKKKKFKNYFK